MDTDLVSRATNAYLEKLEGADAARLEFFRGLWSVQDEMAAELANKHTYEAPTDEEVLEIFESGRTIFETLPPTVEHEELLESLARVVAYVIESGALSEEQTKALSELDIPAAVSSDAVAAAAAAPADFVASAVRALATEERGVTPATAALVVSAALTPFLEKPAREAMDGLRRETRDAGRRLSCPVCGSIPTLAQIGESQKTMGAGRTLWCGLCRSEWDIDRLRCARCGAQSKKSLRYTHVDGDEAHRLHLCENCHAYTRTVFRGNLTVPLSMQVEDIVTTELELIGIEEGYTSLGDTAGSGTVEVS